MMYTDEQTKADRVRAYLVDHPDDRPSEIARALQTRALQTHGVKVSDVNGVRMTEKRRARRLLKKRESSEPQRRLIKQGPPNRPSMRTYYRVVDVVEFIRACGGVEEARTTLRAAEPIAEALGL